MLRSIALTLLTRFQTAAAIRQAGPAKISAWLRKRGTYSPDAIAQTAASAAACQYTVVPGEQTAAKIVAQVASQITALDSELDAEAEITDRFPDHAYAPAIESMPGFGPLLGAEFVVGIIGNLANYEKADRVTSIAGLAPVPHDCGRISGNLNAHADMTGGCCVPAAWPPTTASEPTQSHAPSMNVNELLANARTRLY